MEKLLKQYWAIKEKYSDAILLFRVGDFYETLNEDAKTLALQTGATLQEQTAKGELQFLSSLPVTLLKSALRRLVKAGHRVAICEQLEDPKMTKGFVKRGVTDLLKPGH